jgi:hypothetical protein
MTAASVIAWGVPDAATQTVHAGCRPARDGSADPRGLHTARYRLNDPPAESSKTRAMSQKTPEVGNPAAVEKRSGLPDRQRNTQDPQAHQKAAQPIKRRPGIFVRFASDRRVWAGDLLFARFRARSIRTSEYRVAVARIGYETRHSWPLHARLITSCAEKSRTAGAALCGVLRILCAKAAGRRLPDPVVDGCPGARAWCARRASRPRPWAEGPPRGGPTSLRTATYVTRAWKQE